MYGLNLFIIFLFFIDSIYFTPTKASKFEYYSEKDLESFLKNFTNTTKNVRTEMYSIGNSAYKKSPLWVMKLSRANESRIAIPNIKYIANIHGNEAIGRELLLHFMEYLRDNYDKNILVKCLLDNAYIHLLPCMNPDEFDVASQGKYRGELGRNNGEEGKIKDFNRNFPDFYDKHNNPIELETRAVMNWMDEIPFILSAGIYGGTMVANYPSNTMEIKKTSNEHPTSKSPDDDVFRNLASVYASNHPRMKNSQCEDNKPIIKKFKNGMTNSFQGDMQDYNYEHGSMEIALNISCCKYPSASRLSKLWDQNKKALLMYSLEALKGVSGQVIDDKSRKPIENAILRIVGRNITFKSSKKGEFWRILLPGTYYVEVEAPGYQGRIEKFIVKTTKNTCPHPTKLQILLTKSSTSRITTMKSYPLRRFGRSKFLDTKDDINPTHSNILNEHSFVGSLSPKEEEEIFTMLFGPPREFKGLNVTERDIRDFMLNDLGLNDTSTFDSILKNFDTKTDAEKIEIIVNLGKNLKDVPESFTDVEVLRKYIRRNLGIDNFEPYEEILRDYDEKNATEKKEALMQLLKKFNEQSSKNVTIIPAHSTLRVPTTTAIYTDISKNSTYFLRINFSLYLLPLVVFISHILFNGINL